MYEETAIDRRAVRKYYGKRAGGLGDKDSMTTAERVSIHRTLKNMVQKGLLQKGPHQAYILTLSGFQAHRKANDSANGGPIVSFKEHEERREKGLAEFEQWLDGLKRLAGLTRRR